VNTARPDCEADGLISFRRREDDEFPLPGSWFQRAGHGDDYEQPPPKTCPGVAASMAIHNRVIRAFDHPPVRRHERSAEYPGRMLPAVTDRIRLTGNG
jgi:hypothetical protein